MKTPVRLDGSALGPEALKTVSQAFYEAWSMIEGQFSEHEREAARTELAKALLSVAWEESCDVTSLARGAVEAMVMSKALDEAEQPAAPFLPGATERT
jgi:hypothetical protein